MSIIEIEECTDGSFFIQQHMKDPITGEYETVYTGTEGSYIAAAAMVQKLLKPD
jgi:hypothetical protein